MRHRAVDRRLRVLIGDVGGDADNGTAEAPALQRAVPADLKVAGERGPVLAFLQRTHLGGQDFGQHRHDAVGEIDRVAAAPGVLIQRGAGAYIEADIRNRDHRLPPAGIGGIVVGGGPDRIVMVARIRRVDRDDGQRTQILAVVAQRLCGDTCRFLQRLGLELVGDLVAVDRDQREAARGERIAQPLGHAHRDARRPPCLFGKYQVAGTRIARVGDEELAPFLLLDARQPQPPAFLAQHAQHLLRRTRQRLHRMRGPPPLVLLGPRQHPVPDPQAATLALAHPQARRRCVLGLPTLRNGPDSAGIVDIGDAQHRDAGQSAHAVEGASGGAVDQPLVPHVLEQRLQRDLVLRDEAKGARDLPLAGGLVGCLDKGEDLFAGGQALFRLLHRNEIGGRGAYVTPCPDRPGRKRRAAARTGGSCGSHRPRPIRNGRAGRRRPVARLRSGPGGNGHRG